MTNSHGYILEYPRIRVDHFDQAPIPLPASILAHREATRTVPQQPPIPTFSPGQTHFEKPLLYLLTHIHTDHLKGLERPGITAPIYCSQATKNLLLRYERQKTRIERDQDAAAGGGGAQCVVRPYAHLRVSDHHASAKAKLSGYQASSIDLLRPLPYNTPTKVRYTPTTMVTLTLIESNHMFGGAMFLVEGPNGAVLHTGDFRAEEWWCDALTRNPVLSRYVSWSRRDHSDAAEHGQAAWADSLESLGSVNTTSASSLDDESQSTSKDASQEGHAAAPSFSGATKSTRTSPLHLENIYLDTELLMCNQKVPNKHQACQDMITLMQLYPSDTIFFLNSWTWGYEGMLIATAKAFGSKIHVDRFKSRMYKAAKSEYPFLSEIVTRDPTKSRFHACEKRNLCPLLQQLASRYNPATAQDLVKQVVAAHSQMDSDSPDDGKRWGQPRSQPSPLLVYINPGQVPLERWSHIFEDTKRRLKAAQNGETAWPEALIVPIERHSTLPELQNFVGLFRPKTVSPNTILDPKGGLDYYLLHYMFGHLLYREEDQDRMAREGLALLGDRTWSFYEEQIQKARDQAQRGAGESTEAHRGGSGSWKETLGSHSGGGLDDAQLQRLSRLRGLSFKGIMMQNMAGNLAAMLEIERWRRAEGIDEAVPDLQQEAEDLDASLGSAKDMSVSSANYDADHSQVAETQVPLRKDLAQRPLSGVNEGAASLRMEGSQEQREAAQREHSAPDLLDRTNEVAAAHVHGVSPHEVSQDHEHSQVSAGSLDDAPTVLTEDLANRYLNVLIHYFKVPFDRSSYKLTYKEMWKIVRREMAAEAQKVEEHWFRECGVLPPLWASQPEGAVHSGESTARVPSTSSESQHVQHLEVQDADPSATEHDSMDENKISTAANILLSFVVMLDSTPVSTSQEVILSPTSHDKVAALNLILQHFRRIGFVQEISPRGSSYGQSHPSCSSQPDTATGPWMHFQYPLQRLATALVSNLNQALARLNTTGPAAASINTDESIEEEKDRLSIQVISSILSSPLLNKLIEPNDLRSLLSGLISIIETLGCVSQTTRHHRLLLSLACAAVRREEVQESVLAPLEERLLALAADESGPLRNPKSMTSEESQDSHLGRPLQRSAVPIREAPGVTTDEAGKSCTRRSPSQMAAVREIVMRPTSFGMQNSQEEDDEVSSLQIRAPVPAAAIPTWSGTDSHRSPRLNKAGKQPVEVGPLSNPGAEGFGSVNLLSAGETHSISSAPAHPGISQGSSITQEEDSTEEEGEDDLERGATVDETPPEVVHESIQTGENTTSRLSAVSAESGQVRSSNRRTMQNSEGPQFKRIRSEPSRSRSDPSRLRALELRPSTDSGNETDPASRNPPSRARNSVARSRQQRQ